MGSHALLQGIFPTQELNPRLLMSPALAGGFFTTRASWEALCDLGHSFLSLGFNSLDFNRED